VNFTWRANSVPWSQVIVRTSVAGSWAMARDMASFTFSAVRPSGKWSNIM
jgi:hypothetical protein